MQKTSLCLPLIIIFLIFFSPALADEDWSGFSDIDKAWDGQKPVTNQEFEKAIDVFDGQRKRKEEKKKKKAGKAINSQDAGELLKNIDDSRPILNLTVRAFVNDYVLEPGHYKVIGTRINDNIVLLFCQGRSIIAKVPAWEVSEDFDEKALNFIKIEVVNDNQIRVMFGSMEFNALGYLYYDSMPSDY